MLIRLFFNTKNVNEVQTEIKDIISFFQPNLIKDIAMHIEPYWKIDTVTVGEVKIHFKGKIDKDIIHCFLKRISNKWEFFGEDEALSSSEMKDCKLSNDLIMANIFFNTD